MARIKRIPTDVDPVDESVNAAATATPAPAREAKDRLSVTLAADGRVDWESMRPETRERARRAFGVGVGDGVASGSVPASSTGNSEQVVARIYDCVGAALQIWASRQGLPDQVAGHLRFTEAEKSELVPSTKKVLDKYVNLGRWQDEAELAMTLGGMLALKIEAIKQAVAELTQSARSGASVN